MTFEASRAENIGHADLAFAIFHAFFNEPLSLENDGSSKNHQWRFTKCLTAKFKLLPSRSWSRFSTNMIFQYYETWLNGKFYEPPISFNGLAKSFGATPYLSTAIIYKRINWFQLLSPIDY